jgi:diaminopimelate epimerase
VHSGRMPAETWFPVELPGGVLKLWVAKDLSQVELEGPATFVYEAQADLTPR